MDYAAEKRLDSDGAWARVNTIAYLGVILAAGLIRLTGSNVPTWASRPDRVRRADWRHSHSV